MPIECHFGIHRPGTYWYTFFVYRKAHHYTDFNVWHFICFAKILTDNWTLRPCSHGGFRIHTESISFKVMGIRNVVFTSQILAICNGKIPCKISDVSPILRGFHADSTSTNIMQISSIRTRGEIRCAYTVDLSIKNNLLCEQPLILQWRLQKTH